jgi:hypothetical protein
MVFNSLANMKFPRMLNFKSMVYEKAILIFYHVSIDTTGHRVTDRKSSPGIGGIFKLLFLFLIFFFGSCERFL